MKPSKTIVWLLLAGGLFGFIYFFHPHPSVPPTHETKVLPELKPEAVTSILIRPSGPAQLQIRADHTNGTWQLSQPLAYAAEVDRVRILLDFLKDLKAAPYISGSELRTHPNADEEYGFAAPQATIVIQQGAYNPRLRVGALTNPGDQVFLQVEGDLGAYVVDAKLLKYLPHSANDWRERALLNLAASAFDRVAVTNNSKGDSEHGGLPASSSTFVLQRESTNGLWRMFWPLDARANEERIQDALEKLQKIRIREFVSDDSKPDLESFGLQPAELELGFANGTNGLGLVQFGKSPTNEPTRIYARRAGQNAIFTVDRDRLLSWCGFLNDFRDRRLFDTTEDAESIEVTCGGKVFNVKRTADQTWHISPGEFAADQDSIRGLLSTLTNLEVATFVNDVVNPADLPDYGLAPPLYRLMIRSKCAAAATNVITQVDFGRGTNLNGNIFAKRSDESFVYAISTNDFERLPTAGWQLRDRKLCRFTMADVTGLTLRQGAKTVQMIHKGPLSWSFAPGSQGIINDAAIEETLRGVVQLSAIVWAAHGETNQTAYGFGPDAYHLTLALKSGGSFEVTFGGEAPTGNIYASVMLEGEPWILEFPWNLYRDIAAYLPLRPGAR